MRFTLRPYLTTGIAALGAAIVAVPPGAPASSVVQTHAVRLTSGEGSGDNIAFIVGGSGMPIPTEEYVTKNNELFIQHLYPDQGYQSEGVFTPEGNYALYTGVKSLTLDQSELQGVTILKDTIEKQYTADPDGHIVLLGDSQSSTISSMLMPELKADSVVPMGPDSPLNFVLLADPNQPDGGLFERLSGVTIPSLGITFNGATPDDVVPTTIYMQAYDGFSDVPRYPIDFLADLNSVLGIQYVHPTYQGLDAAQVAEFQLMPGSHDLGADTLTNYYALPLEDETVPYLPLLRPLLAIPGIGKPLADLLQPSLIPLINIGYGDPDYAWDVGNPANVATPFGLLPSSDMIVKALEEAVQGIPTGFKDAFADLSSGGGLSASLPSLADLSTPSLADLDPTHIINALTAAVSTGYAALLPTADVLTGVSITIPNYDLQWFTDGLTSGDPFTAIGEPLANDTYLFTLAAGFEAFALISSVESVVDDLSGLF